MTSQKSSREAEMGVSTDELEVLNLLQAEMQKRTEELQRIRLGLFPSVTEDVSTEGMLTDYERPPRQDMNIGGIPEERLKSAEERIKSRAQGSQSQDPSTNLTESDFGITGKLAGPGNHLGLVLSRAETDISKKSPPQIRDMTIIDPRNRYYPYDEVPLVTQSWSFPNWNEANNHIRSVVSSSSLPTYSNSGQDLMPSTIAQLEKESAAGRVLLDSLANENKLDEKLGLAELQLQALKTKISQLEETHRKDVDEHKATIHVLLQRVDDVSKRKQQEINGREKERTVKEELILKLNKTVQNLEKAMQLLEKKLAATEHDLSQERGRCTSQTEALLQIYDAVKPKMAETDECEEEGGGEIAPVTPYVISERVHGYIQGRENQAIELIQRQQESEDRRRALRTELDKTVVKLKADHQQRYSQLTEVREAELKAASERAVNARQQTLSLQSQLRTLEEHSQLEVEAKSKEISRLLEKNQKQREDVEELKSQEQREVIKYRNELRNGHELLEAKDLQICTLEKQLEPIQEDLRKTKENLENVLKDLSEANEEKCRLIKLRDDVAAELAGCQAMLQEKSKEVAELKEKIKRQEEANNVTLRQEIDSLKEESKRRLEEQIDALKEESKRRLDKERKTSKEKMRILTEEAEDNAKRKNSELRKVKDANKEQLNRIIKLQSEVEIIGQEKSELTSLLEGKDKDLLMLQHERNILENLYEKSKTEFRLEFKDKSKVENELQEIEPRYQELLMENQNLLSEMEKTAEQLSECVTERNQLVDRIQQRDVQLENMMAIRDDLDKKLNISEETLKQVRQSLKKAETFSEKKISEMKNLVSQNEKLEDDLKEETKKDLQLADERTSLLRQSKEQKIKFEKNRGMLKSQIKLLQNELSLLRGTIHADNAIKGKAVEEAAGIKRDVALQRDLVESLQGEINWLEERLLITQETLRSLEEKANKWDGVKRKSRNRIEKLENERKEMIVKRKDQKALVLKLESALEKSSLRYGESQQQLEIQSQELARLRLQHQLELKELKGNLINRLTKTFILPKVENSSKHGSNTHKQIDKPDMADGCNRWSKAMSEAGLKAMLKELMTVMLQQGLETDIPKRIRDAEANDIRRSLEAINNSWRNSSCDDLKESFRLASFPQSADVGDYGTSQCTRESLNQRDDSKLHCSTSLSPLCNKHETPGTMLASPVSTLLSRGCLPEDMAANPSYLETKPCVNAARGTDAWEKDKTRQHLSKDSHKNVKVKGFVDKLDILTLLGNQLMDENKEMEMILMEEER